MTPLIQQIAGLTNRIVPPGGMSGQLLGKTGNSDYQFGWVTPEDDGFDEIDPIFTASPAYNITNTEIINWNTAYSWGNPALAGYLKIETEPAFTSSPSASITSLEINNWNTAFSWGNPATAGYLLTETDPIFSASPSSTITSGMITNWNQAYSEEHVHNNFALLQSLVSNGNGSLVLTNNGTYVPITSIVVSGSDTQIQYNANGVLSASSGLTYNYSSTLLSSPFILATSQLQIGDSTAYISGGANMTFTDSTSGSHTLASLIGSATNYWTSVSGGINYAGSVGRNTPGTLTSTLTINGTISGTGFTSTVFQYTNNNILIGSNAGLQETTSNKLYIANSNTATPLIYGDFNSQYITINGSIYLPYGYDLYFNDNNVKIYWGTGDNLVFQDLVANTANPVTLASLMNGTYNALKADFAAYSSVTAITASQIAVWNKASVLNTSGSSTMFLAQNGNYYTVSGSGSMTWPTVAGIANYSGSNSWSTSYSVSGTNTVLVSTNGSGASLTGITTTQISGMSLYATLASPTFSGTVTMPISLSGIAKLTSGVLGTATAGIDYLLPSGSGAGLIGITTSQISGISSYALVASPTFTGTVTMPVGLTGIAKLTSGVLSTAIANTDYLTPTGSGTGLIGIVTTASLTTTLASYETISALTTTLSSYSPLASPSFTGTVTATALTITGALTASSGINIPTGQTYKVNNVPLVTMTYPAAGIPLSVSGTSWGTSFTTTGSGTIIALANSPVFTGTVTYATPFTLGSTSVTTSGTQLNYLNASTGTTGTTSSSLVFSASPTFTGIVSGITSTMTGSEPALGNPSVSGYVLSSTTGGVRTWVSTSSSFPPSGIPNSTGSAWSTSFSTTGSGTVIALASSPTFTGTVSGITAVMVSAVPNVLTTTGDIIYSSATTTAHRLGIGSTGQILTVASGLPTWSTPVSSMIYPGSGIPKSTGSAWSTSYGITGSGTNIVTDQFSIANAMTLTGGTTISNNTGGLGLTIQTNTSTPFTIITSTGNTSNLINAGVNGNGVFVVDYLGNTTCTNVVANGSMSVASGASVTGNLAVTGIISGNIINVSSTAIHSGITTLYATSGSAVCSMPDQGTTFKRALIYLIALQGPSTTYTFPVAFTVTPSVIVSTTIPNAIMNNGTLTTTSITFNITGAYTGFIEVIGY